MVGWGPCTDGPRSDNWSHREADSEVMGRRHVTGRTSSLFTRRVAFAVVAAVAIAACGSNDGAGGEPRPLERDEANRLANALFANYEQQGATFSYRGQVGDGTLILDGEIDFVGHQGRATVTGDGVESAVVEVVWSDAQVIERIPALATELAGDGSEPVEWIVREPRIDQRALDDAIAVITGLASERRDNPQLIVQEPGSAFLRRQEFRQTEVEVLRFGERTSYWLSIDTGELVRFEGNNSTGTRPRVIDLSDRGQRSITAPPSSQVVDVRDVEDAYQRVLGAS